MCFGSSGGDGGDASATVKNNPEIGPYNASGVKGGRGDRGGRAEGAGISNADDGRDVGSGTNVGTNRGEIAEGATFKSATGWVARFIGDTRSDQDIKFDKGEGPKGQTSRNKSPPTPGSILANINTRPDFGTFLGAVASVPFRFPLGILAGAAVKAGYRYLGSGSSTKANSVMGQTSKRWSGDLVDHPPAMRR